MVLSGNAHYSVKMFICVKLTPPSSLTYDPMQVSDRAERLTHLQLELTSVRSSQEHIKRSLAVKEQLVAQLSQENRVLRENLSQVPENPPCPPALPRAIS